MPEARKNKPYSPTDILSKTFIITEFLLGLNRFELLCASKVMWKKLSCLISMSINAFIVYITIISVNPVMQSLKLPSYIISCALGFATRKKLQDFYHELHKFDAEVNYKVKAKKGYLKTGLQTSLAVTFTVFATVERNMNVPLLIHLIHVLENHYYGHLFYMIECRLECMNFCIKSTYETQEEGVGQVKITTEVENSPDESKDERSQTEMNKLMDLYYIMINAFDLLTRAIKWQLLLVLMSSFAYTLCVSYFIADGFLFRNEPYKRMLHDLYLLVVEIMPVLAPCMRCDAIRAQVAKLRELLAYKLYEKTLDKTSRSVARSLLALTEARNLSFSLLRMVDVSITLPFSFLGLVATYLIIILQFVKVVDPNTHVE